jgi:hypothetical protein
MAVASLHVIVFDIIVVGTLFSHLAGRLKNVGSTKCSRIDRVQRDGSRNI